MFCTSFESCTQKTARETSKGCIFHSMFTMMWKEFDMFGNDGFSHWVDPHGSWQHTEVAVAWPRRKSTGAAWSWTCRSPPGWSEHQECLLTTGEKGQKSCKSCDSHHCKKSVNVHSHTAHNRDHNVRMQINPRLFTHYAYAAVPKHKCFLQCFFAHKKELKQPTIKKRKHYFHYVFKLFLALENGTRSPNLVSTANKSASTKIKVIAVLVVFSVCVLGDM